MSSPDTAVQSSVLGSQDDEALPARQLRVIAELGGDVAFAIALPVRRLVYLSPAFGALSGFDREALQRALDGDGVSPLAPLAAWLREAAGGESGARSQREFDLFDAEGRPLALEGLATVQADPAPTLVGLLRDLSARRAHQSEQKRFASMLNHEFRTPLATIDGAIQRLEATSSHADEPTRTRYRKIGAAVDRLIAMLDEYLSPDRMAALGRARQPNTITVRDLVESGATQIRAAGREAALRLEELPLTLRGEPEGLRLALKVLIDNALAFSPPSAPVILRARRSGGGVELAVIDGGAGVPPEDVARVFDKGYRGRNAAGLAGSGLGLYMARSIVEVHGGVLSLAPGEEGAGAEFRLWMPALAL
ncbi:sensor histidine kinase [Massilia oculi]|uniref:sensor histidine kinase n=1 Tax=Massilia oculi TaxID=945844 RepID=UPI001E5A1A52|nr:HAMP domain-containing sensor histidine kinase [Massilia oculi]